MDPLFERKSLLAIQMLYREQRGGNSPPHSFRDRANPKPALLGSHLLVPHGLNFWNHIKIWPFGLDGETTKF